MDAKLSKRLQDLSQVLSGIDWNEDFYNERVHSFEPYDEIRMKVVPRFKTSGLSGDEWRNGVQIELFFKGKLVKEAFRSKMEYAVGGLYGIIHDDSPASEEWLGEEKRACDQPGCSNDAQKWFAIRKKTAKDGSWLAEDETGFVYFRKFCNDHFHRGDANREDNDKNYVPIKKIV